MTQMSMFGFSTENASGDFTPYIKYDARSGVFSRIDRILDAAGQAQSHGTYIEWQRFRAVCDFENLETGALNFSGPAPQMRLVKVADLMAGRAQLPTLPSKDFKHGLRLIIKLAADVGGEKPVREWSSSAKALVRGLQGVYAEYLRLAPQNSGMLPVIGVASQPLPVRSGAGNKSSTNFEPVFHIIGWVARPADLIWKPREPTPELGAQGQQYAPQGYTPPPQQGWQPGYGQQQAAQQPSWQGGQGQSPATGGNPAPVPPAAQQAAPPREAAPPPAAQQAPAPVGGFNARDFG